MDVSHGGWEGETNNKRVEKGLKEARKNERWYGKKSQGNI